MAYLDDHPPARHQFRQRYAQPSGLIVVHTAESALDDIGEDTGAEGVAAFIARRSDPGSYHRIVDSDSIVALVRFDQAAYGDGTGSNEFAIHVSFACRAADWPHMDPDRREAFLANGARAAREAATWLADQHGITVPARRVTRAQSDQRAAGFISHAERDPEADRAKPEHLEDLDIGAQRGRRIEHLSTDCFGSREFRDLRAEGLRAGARQEPGRHHG